MRSMPVSLDDQPFHPPDEVGFERSTRSLDPSVDLGLDDASAATNPQEALLELTSGEGRAEIVNGEGCTKGRATVAAKRAGEQVTHRRHVQNSKHLCLIERTLQATAIHNLREIEKRPRYRRARNPTGRPHILRSQSSRSVAVNPSVRAF